MSTFGRFSVKIAKLSPKTGVDTNRVVSTRPLGRRGAAGLASGLTSGAMKRWNC